MPGVEHHHAAVNATTAVRAGHPPEDDFRQELWQDYHQLIMALRDAVVQLHATASSAAEAHEAHTQRAEKRVEHRATHANDAEQHVHHTRAAAEQAQAETGHHEEGSDAHATAHATHTQAQEAHGHAQQAHETAAAKHQQAHEHHEKAKHLDHHSHVNKQLADEMKAIADELVIVVQEVVHASAQLPPDASPDQRADLRKHHQAPIDKIGSHVSTLEERQQNIHPESLEHPEDDSDLDRD